jgi:hypothetical protein
MISPLKRRKERKEEKKLNYSGESIVIGMGTNIVALTNHIHARQ